MQIWLIEAWTGAPANIAPDEHDAIAWFGKNELADLRLAHESYLELFTKALAWPSHRAADAALIRPGVDS
jgi:8-oxo-dGTP diphosphatase